MRGEGQGAQGLVFQNGTPWPYNQAEQVTSPATFTFFQCPDAQCSLQATWLIEGSP